ncbi:hypothetical protein REH65_31195 [Saccharopolyspora sp. ID03-671]|uniref:hypothetical protein n=1 Tax=Saccharopolyspora sp. ID03-671 TaxID=3073066 RepID=UPI0032438EF4
MQHIDLHLIRTARYWRELRLLCWLALAYPPRRLRRLTARGHGDDSTDLCRDPTTETDASV